MVQNVEGVELEFEFQLLSQGGDLESAEVKGDVTGSAEGVPAAVSKNLFVGGNAKSIDVEPLLNRARSIGAHPRHDRADVFFKERSAGEEKRAHHDRATRPGFPTHPMNRIVPVVSSRITTKNGRSMTISK